TPAQLRANLGSQTVGADPTRIDPSTDTSQGYADELIRQLAGDMLTSGIADTLRQLSGLDVARIELNLASFGFHGEKRLFENLDLVGDLERTSRGSTLDGKIELRFPVFGYQVSGQLSYLRKDYDDAAERDVKDVEVKLVVPLFLRTLLGP
ncbi:MAG TPA: hypothetical protein VHE35_29385, partial [Kofleriaceae bacterium]|nr:hypothetical protein [Kofleriaceae bacterium]